MKVHIVGRQFKVPPEAETYARDKFSKLGKYFAGIQHADVVMASDGHAQQRRHEVEASVTLGRGTRLLGRGAGADLTSAIDDAEAKLEKQIRRFHARLKAHRDRTRISDSKPAVAEQDEATYEQVVREMLDEEEE
jgi:ribosomal subunit interface protein